MMRGSLKSIWSTARSSRLAVADGFPVPLVVQPLRTARRVRLRFDAGRGVLKLTCPLRMSRRAALAWASEQRDWIEAQVAAALPAIPFAPGSTFPIEGAGATIDWAESNPRRPRLDDGRLICGGPLEALPRRIERFLKARALVFLSRETAEFAAAAGLTVNAVSVGDADTRWGSCSSGGRIRYSWRLILAPSAARRYVVAHEVAHLAHLNHGPEFKALERRLFGEGLAEARALLRAAGPRLKRVGRGS